MSNDPNVFDPDRAIAAMRKIHAENKDAPDPADLFDPTKGPPKIISKEEAQRRDAEWRKANPRSYVPPTPPYHVNALTGDWEQWMRERDSSRPAAGTVVEHTVIVDAKNQLRLLQGNMTRFFSDENEVVGYLHKKSAGGKTKVCFYSPPTVAGDTTGHFLHAEEFGG